MDRETIAVLSYRAGQILFFCAVLTSVVLQAPEFMGIIMAAFGVQQVYFRQELAAYYGKVPRVWGPNRGSLRRSSFHLIRGVQFLLIGLILIGAWLVKMVGLIDWGR